MENKNKKEGYNIYYHNDFDGVSAAAIFVNFLLKNKEKIKSLNPLDFSFEEKWSGSGFFKNNLGKIVILDFFYHPRADFWFDHHPTAFLKKEWKEKFKETKFEKIDSSYFSASHLAYDSLRGGFDYKPPKFIKSLVDWADIIDGARYRSPQETIFADKPAILLAALIDRRRKNSDFLNFIIYQLAQFPIFKVITIPKIKKDVKKVIKERQIAREFFSQNTKFYDNKVAFIDLSDNPTIPNLRFFSYYFNPKIIYNLAITKGRNLFYLHLGYNPWRRQKQKIHLGEFLKKYNGGGHKKAAGAEFKSKTKTDKAVNEIIEYLLKNG